MSALCHGSRAPGAENGSTDTACAAGAAGTTGGGGDGDRDDERLAFDEQSWLAAGLREDALASFDALDNKWQQLTVEQFMVRQKELQIDLFRRQAECLSNQLTELAQQLGQQLTRDDD